jgi:transposase
MEGVMEQRRGQLGTEDIAVGVDLGSEGHQVVVLDARGQRLTSFRIAHSLKGFEELMRRCEPARLGAHTGRAVVAFEATGHFWEALAHFLSERRVPYALINPLATFRVREARQMGRDKRDLTDAEQIADLLRVGMVTETQLAAPPYVALRRAWNEYDRLRGERARLKTLLRHELYGVFPELVTVWKDALTPGLLAVLRLGLSPTEIAACSRPEFWQAIQTTRRGRRVWRFKIDQVHDRAGSTVAPPHAREATTRALQRLVARVDLLADQLEHLSGEIQAMLTRFDEARHLATMPGIGWPTVAGVLAEIGPIANYRHGRQLVKLAGDDRGPLGPASSSYRRDGAGLGDGGGGSKSVVVSVRMAIKVVTAGVVPGFDPGQQPRAASIWRSLRIRSRRNEIDALRDGRQLH